MGISFFLDFVLFSAISFLVKKKSLHVIEYIFVLVFMVFLCTSYFSVIVDNLDLWKINQKPVPFLTYRVAEIILLPLISLWFLDLFYLKRDNYLFRTLVFLFFLTIPLLIEKWLIYINVLSYKKWEGYQTIIIWFFFYLITLLLQFAIRRLLVKEGIVKDAPLS